MEVKINLDDKSQAIEQVKKIQESIDDLISVCSKQKDQLAHNASELDKAAKTIVKLSDQLIDFSEALKNVNRVLLSKKDLWKDDEEINELCNVLSKFVMSSAAIKLGALNHAKSGGK